MMVTLLNAIRALMILVTLALALGFFYALYQSWRFRPTFHLEKEKAKKISTLRGAFMKERWRAVVKRFSLGTPESMRIAIIEADALVDAALKDMDVPGEHLADRLLNLETEDIKSMSLIWQAHRMRNDLVHTPGFALSPEDAKTTIDHYEAFLKEMEVL